MATADKYTAKYIYDNYGAPILGNSEAYVLLYRFDITVYHHPVENATITKEVFITAVSKTELDSDEVIAILDNGGTPRFGFGATGVIDVEEI